MYLPKWARGDKNLNVAPWVNQSARSYMFSVQIPGAFVLGTSSR